MLIQERRRNSESVNSLTTDEATARQSNYTPPAMCHFVRVDMPWLGSSILEGVISSMALDYSV